MIFDTVRPGDDNLNFSLDMWLVLLGYVDEPVAKLATSEAS